MCYSRLFFFNSQNFDSPTAGSTGCSRRGLCCLPSPWGRGPSRCRGWAQALAHAEAQTGSENILRDTDSQTSRTDRQAQQQIFHMYIR